MVAFAFLTTIAKSYIIKDSQLIITDKLYILVVCNRFYYS